MTIEGVYWIRGIGCVVTTFNDLLKIGAKVSIFNEEGNCVRTATVIGFEHFSWVYEFKRKSEVRKPPSIGIRLSGITKTDSEFIIGPGMEMRLVK